MGILTTLFLLVIIAVLGYAIYRLIQNQSKTEGCADGLCPPPAPPPPDVQAPTQAQADPALAGGAPAATPQAAPGADRKYRLGHANDAAGLRNMLQNLTQDINILMHMDGCGPCQQLKKAIGGDGGNGVMFTRPTIGVESKLFAALAESCPFTKTIQGVPSMMKVGPRNGNCALLGEVLTGMQDAKTIDAFASS